MNSSGTWEFENGSGKRRAGKFMTVEEKLRQLARPLYEFLCLFSCYFGFSKKNIGIVTNI
jgi:hypothetical protein